MRNLTREEMVRLAWLAALRWQGSRQCSGNYVDGARVCALGLLAEVGGMPISDDIDFDAVGALAGLDTLQSQFVFHMNDGIDFTKRATFAQIAQQVASWFPSTQGSEASDEQLCLAVS